MGNKTPSIENIVKLLNELRQVLKRILEEAEIKFLRLCQDLQSVASDTDQFTQLTIKAVKEITGGSDEDFFGRIRILINKSQEELGNCRNEISGNLNIIKNNSNYLQKLSATSLVIKTIAKNLSIIAVNIGIESSRSRDCEQMFAVFVKELQELARLIKDVSLNIREDSEIARLNQLVVLKGITGRQRQLAKLTSESDKAVQESIRKIEKLINISTEALESAGRHSQEISRQINEIIVAIQFHDIVRQQIEHVLESFLDVEKICNEESLGAGAEYDKDRLFGRVQSILAVQAAQMEHVVSEIEGVHTKTMEAFEKIGDEVGMLVKGTSRLEQGDMSEIGTAGPFAAFKSSIENLSHLLGQCYVLRSQVKETIRQSSEIVSRLTAHLHQIEDIGSDLHIKAINSILLSMRLNENGKTLVILAQEVTGVSTKSNKFVWEVVEILKSIKEMADKLIHASSGEKETLNHDDNPESALTEGIRLVSHLYDCFLENCSISRESSIAINDEILTVESNLSFLTEMKSQISGCLKRLQDVVIELESFSDGSTDEFEQIAERYTMDTERGVHNRTFCGTDDFKDSSKERPKNEMDMPEVHEQPNDGIFDLTAEDDEDSDYLGDNVELF